ncbi:hypothetical protein SISSUDRAFT_457459 [Sistotremastrum suecicum HHB10207 ss-3]|uniref:Uncharacterized protein n=1 Tax=Sistotremastrum suecicum HHB10207 ss-3 TaxID=1314776 RepID=A0A165Y7Q3_9AGAM|nr:hypothetical protein SISSUDRAFT_457459 [Sistotremastrum suecicum HHB10207 ss-3]
MNRTHMISPSSASSIMHLILFVSLLAACAYALVLDPVYMDEDGVLWSHPVMDGKAVTTNHTLKPLSNRALLAAGLPPRSPKFVRDAVAKRVPTPAGQSFSNLFLCQAASKPVNRRGAAICGDYTPPPVGFIPATSYAS